MQRLLPLVNKTGANSITVVVCGGNFAGDSFPPPAQESTSPFPISAAGNKYQSSGGKGGGGLNLGRRRKGKITLLLLLLFLAPGAEIILRWRNGLSQPPPPLWKAK